MRYCPTCGTRFEDEVRFCLEDGAQTIPLDEEPGTDPLIGTLLDRRYRVEKQIGEGGMGIVYLATHAVLNKRLAIKVLRPDLAKDQDTLQRFVQEAQAATSIGHENIIDISDFGRLEGGAVFFVMEYLDGSSLSDYIERGGSIPVQEALNIIRQIASALGAAHAHGIVHRDLKPDNVFLIKRGKDDRFVKVLDFGIAKVGGAASKLTKTGMIFGTPHYMSPEQAAGQTVDHRTDIYALGVIMYEMFAGEVPFDADTFMGILSKHMFEAPIPPGQRSGRQLGALEGVVMRALQKKPEDRFPDTAAFIEALAAMTDLPNSIGPGVPPPVLADRLEPLSHTEMRLSGAALAPRRGLLIGAGLLGAALLAAGLVALYVSGAGDTGAVLVATDPALAGADDAAVQNVGSLVVEPAADAGTPAVVARRLVEVQSAPRGAQVSAAGAVVGNTPVSLRAPAGEQTIEVTVSLAGYRTKTLTLGRDSNPVAYVRLEREPEKHRSHSRHRRRRRRDSTMAMTSAQVMEAPAMMHRRMMSTGITTEVVDPWAQ